MYRVLAAASLAASFGLATAGAFPAHAGGGHGISKFSPKVLAQPVIGNPGIGVLRRPLAGQHVRGGFAHHRGFNNFGFGAGFICFDGLNCASGNNSNTNTIINNVGVGLGGSGVQTVAGIREAPPMRPAIYVIDEAGEGARQRSQRQGGARVVEFGAAGWTELETPAQDGYGPRIIRVPAR